MKNDQEEYKEIYKGALFKRVENIHDNERILWIMNRICQYPEGSKILELGCSHGLLGYLLRDTLNVNGMHVNVTGHYEYTGVDYIQESLNEAKKEMNEYNFITQDICKYIPSLEGSFDVCVASQVLEHVTDWKQVLDNMFKYIKKSGMILVTVPREKMIQSKSHINIFDFYKLVDFMEERNEDNYKIFLLKKFRQSKQTQNILGLIYYKGDEYGKGRTFDR